MDDDITMLEDTGEPLALPFRNPGAPERHDEPNHHVIDDNDNHVATQNSHNDVTRSGEAAQLATDVAEADRAVGHDHSLSDTLLEHGVRQWCIWHERMTFHSSEECTRGQRFQAQGIMEPPPRQTRSSRRQGTAASHGRGNSRGGRGGARRGGRGRGRGRGREGRGGRGSGGADGSGRV